MKVDGLPTSVASPLAGPRSNSSPRSSLKDFKIKNQVTSRECWKSFGDFL